MKKIIILFFALTVIGCQYGQYGADRIKSVLTDPHYAQYQQKLDNLEHSYLQGELDYSEYLDKKSQIDEDYTKEVQVRTDIITNQK